MMKEKLLENLKDKQTITPEEASRIIAGMSDRVYDISKIKGNADESILTKTILNIYSNKLDLNLDKIDLNNPEIILKTALNYSNIIKLDKKQIDKIKKEILKDDVLNNIKMGYFDELLEAFNEKYKEYGITAVDAN